jgi:translation elongation factor EF-1alpha
MEEKIGVVEDFFAKISVIAVKLEDDLRVGDKIHIKGHTTDFIQTVESIRIEHQKVNFAKKGDSVGIKVEQCYRKSDVVYKIAE